MQSIRFLAEKARNASTHLALLSSDAKNELLQAIAKKLEENIPAILQENAKDIAAAHKKNLAEGLIDRLQLDQKRMEGIISDLKKVAQLKDYVGDVLESRELSNELFIKRIRVPIGVVGMIYEARPNVTVDASALCLKSGNAVILKGGSDALRSNQILVKLIREGLQESSFLTPESGLSESVQFIDSTDRSATLELLKLHDLVDVIIPRGSKSLIDFVRENSTVPVIETGASVVHTYIHEDADI
ncbi:MAG: glutamate-5-semialdehyde dehydrogenase, partial [Patescibacteria group bacterium]